MKTLALFLFTALAGAGCTAPQEPESQPRPVRVTSLKVVQLRYAMAVEVSNALGKLLKDTRIVPDVRTNSLVISYERPEDLAQIEACIAQLDIEVKPKKE